MCLNFLLNYYNVCPMSIKSGGKYAKLIKGLQAKICKPFIFNGWETRIRTWVDGVRVRSPAAGRSPIFQRSYCFFRYIKAINESRQILYQSFLSLINCTAFCSRDITRFLPSTSIISNIPGLTVFPVSATLTG